jgi:hypothetical protein
MKKSFILLSDGFVWDGVNNRDEDILHLFFTQIHTEVRTNVVLKTGITETAALRIHLKSGKKIVLKSEGGLAPQLLIFRNHTTERQEILDTYLKLSERTFRQRLDFYLDQVRMNGYFIYDECRFYPRQKIQFRNQVFDLASSTFKRSSGYVVLEHKNVGMFGKALRELSLGKVPQFNTQTDTDVIVHLLGELFGLQW